MSTEPSTPRPTAVPTPRRRALGDVARGLQVVRIILTALGSIAAEGAWRRLFRRSRHGPASSGPVRLREMLEQLGPTFTKVGQMIAGRPELAPGPYRTELSHLRDHVTPLAPGVALGVLAAAYHQPLQTVFETLDPEPFAAASVGQVHRATLPDGRAVAVKIRRPDAARLIDADLTFLAAAARILDRLVPRSRHLRLPALVGEFARALRSEVDFDLEATHAGLIRSQLANVPWVTVPAMILPLCRPDVLVMDFVDGVPLTDGDRLDAAGLDRQKLGTEIIAVNLQLILFSDVFHADPHPGNYLLTPDGRLAMLDFGQIGHSSETTRSGLLRLLTALVTGDVIQTANTVRAICGATPDDTSDLGVNVSDLFAGITTKPLGEVRLGDALHRLLSVLAHHDLSLPAEMVILIKAVIECEATAEEIHPGLRLTEIIPVAMNRPRPRPSRPQPTPSAASSLRPRAINARPEGQQLSGEAAFIPTRPGTPLMMTSLDRRRGAI